MWILYKHNYLKFYKAICNLVVRYIYAIISILNKKELRKNFKSMTSRERQELILKKMKAKGIEPGSGVPNKTYKNDDVLDLIKIANCFPELRDNK